MNTPLIKESILFLAFGLSLCLHGQESMDKIQGVNLITPHTEKLTIDHLSSLDKINATWISVIPEVVVLRASLDFDFEYEFIGPYETLSGIEQTIRIAKSSNKKVMLKPHVVFQPLNDMVNPESDITNRTEWRGSFIANSEADWKKLELQYENYILQCAKVAESFEVDLFCIGTELREFAIRRIDFWRDLIQKVRTVYLGPITYSSNWDGYDQIVFWDQLDYIGMNAYFPVSNNRNPDVLPLKSMWNTIKRDVQDLSLQYDKPVLFTEFGWRNVDFCGKEPWTHNSGSPFSNLNAQYNLYTSFFESFWDEEWMAGGFCWNWNYKAVDHSDTNFHINNKPAMLLLQTYFK